MNQPTEAEIKAAVERIGSLIFSDIPSKSQFRIDINIVRAALERALRQPGLNNARP